MTNQDEIIEQVKKEFGGMLASVTQIQRALSLAEKNIIYVPKNPFEEELREINEKQHKQISDLKEKLKKNYWFKEAGKYKAEKDKQISDLKSEIKGLKSELFGIRNRRKEWKKKVTKR